MNLNKYIDCFKPTFSDFKARQKIGYNKTICEIGVNEAQHAKVLLRYFKPKKLILIEPTIKDKLFDFVDKHSNVEWIKDYSYNVISSLDKLDYTYIDGDHSFEGCFSDIVNYYPKSATIGGHDFNQPGVAKAIVKYCEKFDLKFEVGYTIPRPTWIIK